jgi:hypothetical protein
MRRKIGRIGPLIVGVVVLWVLPAIVWAGERKAPERAVATEAERLYAGARASSKSGLSALRQYHAVAEALVNGETPRLARTPWYSTALNGDGTINELFVVVSNGDEATLLIGSGDGAGGLDLVVNATVSAVGNRIAAFHASGFADSMELRGSPEGVTADVGSTYECFAFKKEGESVQVRIICICRNGNGPWSVCLDTGWME